MAKIFITGSSDGLGQLAAKALVSMGHRVVLHARNEARAKEAMSDVPGAENVVIGDLSVIEETKSLAARANELGPYQAVIHNAGVYRGAENDISADGLPLIFAVNSLAPYILTAMIKRPQRLIYLSSGLHKQGDAGEKRLKSILDGKGTPGYSDTKLHDLILAFAVARKWPETISNAVNPGWVPTKMGGSNAPDNLDKGYETQVWLAAGSDKGATISGRYLFHKEESEFNPQAGDQRIQELFLHVCEELSGVKFPA